MSATDPAQVDRMRRAIACLSEPARTVYRLHLLDGFDYPAIAEQLGIECGDVERYVAEAIIVIERALRR